MCWLRSFLALHDNTGRNVGEPDRAAGLVHVLAARAARPENVLAYIRLVDFHLDAVVDLRRDIDRREARLTLAFRIERTDPHEPVDPHFTLQIAVRHRTADGERHALNAGDVVGNTVEDFNRVIVLLGPLRVHPLQHFGPVVGIRPAVASVNAEDRARPVMGAVEQRTKFEVVERCLDALNFETNVSFGRRIIASQFHQAVEIGGGGQGILERFQNEPQRLQFAYDPLSAFLVIPETGPRHSILKFRQSTFFRLEVKDCLAVAPADDELRPPDSSVPHPSDRSLPPANRDRLHLARMF